MALTTGINEVTSGTRASKEFVFQGGGIGYMVTDAPNTTPDWDLQVELPDGTWVRVNANGKQVDSAKPYDTLVVPAGTYRLHCDSTVAGNFTPVSLFWCYVPQSMRDAALY